MARLDYKDFHHRAPSLGARGRIKAIQPSKSSFLSVIDNFLSKNNRRVVNVETHETFYRVWYLEG